MMNKVLIIGYGNITRGDDACGVIAVDRLRERDRIPNCEYITACQPNPEMAAKMAESDLVIFVDTRIGVPAGRLEQQTIQAADEGEAPAMTHTFTPEILLGMSKRLYGHEPLALMFSVTGISFEFGDVLSPGLEKALNELVMRIEMTVHKTLPSRQALPSRQS